MSFCQKPFETRTKHPDFAWSGFWMVGTIAIAKAKAWPFENWNICNLIFKKSGFQIIQKPNIFLLWLKMVHLSDETFFWIFRIQNMDCCQDFRCHSKTKHLRANFICVRKATKTIILEPKSTISDILTSKIYCNWTHFYYFNTDYVWYKDSHFKNNPVVPA